MDPAPLPDLFDWIGPFMILSFAVPLLITGAIIAVVIYAIRRSSPREDPAVSELKARFARGEIDLAEYEVRLRSLTRDRD